MSNNAASTSAKGAGASSTNNQHADELAPAPPSASSTPSSSLTDLIPSGVFRHVVSFTDLRTRLQLCLTCEQVRNAITRPLLGLPSEIVQRIVSFTDRRTSRRELCLTCFTALEAVETYSRQVIQKVKEEYVPCEKLVDHLPYRCNLSHYFMTKSLYEIAVPGVRNFSPKIEKMPKMVISPSEGRIAILQGNGVHLYDTATKQHLATLEHRSRCQKLCFLGENRILVVNSNKSCILENGILVVNSVESCILWSETDRGWRREQNFRIEDYLPDHCEVLDLARHGDKIILYLKDFSAQAEAEGVDFNIEDADNGGALLTVFEINVNSKAGRRLFQIPEPIGAFTVEASFQVVENKWLLFTLENDGGAFGGLYAYNLMAKDAWHFHEGTVPHSMVLALTIGVLCGIATFIYYWFLEFVLELFWKPELWFEQNLPEALHVLWIPLMGFAMATGLGLMVVFLGKPGDLPYTIQCVHDKAYVAMDHVMPMVVALQFSILGGGSPEPRRILDVDRFSGGIVQASDCTNMFYVMGDSRRVAEGLVLTDDGDFSNGAQQFRLRRMRASQQRHTLSRRSAPWQLSSLIC